MKPERHFSPRQVFSLDKNRAGYFLMGVLDAFVACRYITGDASPVVTILSVLGGSVGALYFAKIFQK